MDTLYSVSLEQLAAGAGMDTWFDLNLLGEFRVVAVNR